MWNTMIVSDSNPFGRRVVAHSLRHMHLSEHGLPRSPRVNHHFPWKFPFWAAHPYFQSQPLSIPVLYCCIQFVCMYIYIIYCTPYICYSYYTWNAHTWCFDLVVMFYLWDQWHMTRWFPSCWPHRVGPGKEKTEFAILHGWSKEHFAWGNDG